MSSAPALTPQKVTIGASTVFVDPTYFPLLIMGFLGAPTVETMDAYWQLRKPFLDYAEKTGIKVISITDTSRADVPAATVRKYTAERGALIDAELKSLYLYIPVVPSSIMRGVITAMIWIQGDKSPVKSQTCADFEAAFKLAKQEFDQLGIEWNRPPSPYKSPFV